MPPSAWDSPIVPCRACHSKGCTYRAQVDGPFCCKRCEDVHYGRATGAGERLRGGHHDVSCGMLEEKTVRASWWETFRCDRAYEQDGACLVVPPSRGWLLAEPAPVILFLTGSGHVNDREDFLVGGPDLLLLNRRVREHFWVLAPKPTTATGLVRRTGDGWYWSEDAVWSLFTEVLRRLGRDEVDPTRLYVTGISLGAVATWGLALRFGQHLAAVAPIAGGCSWPDDAWPKGSKGPTDAVLTRLKYLPMRAYQVDVDFRAGHPRKDMEWLCGWCWELEAKEWQLELPGVEVDKNVEVKVVHWKEKGGGGTDWELWTAKGPLMDSAEWKDWGGDTHCLWKRVFPISEWDLAQFFLQHRLSRSRGPEAWWAWHFTDPPFIVDSTGQNLEREGPDWGWWS